VRPARDRAFGLPPALTGVWLALAALILAPPAATASTSNAGTVAVSPGGSQVYAGFNAAGASVFSRSPATGGLSVLDETAGLHSSGAEFSGTIAASPNGKNVYGVTGSGNTLVQYGATSSGLTEQQTYPVLASHDTAEDPVSVAVSPDGAEVYVTTYGYATGAAITSRGAITAYLRNPENGDLTDAGTTTVDCCGGVSGVVSSPDSKFVYVADAGQPGGVDIFSRDPATGALKEIGTTLGVNGGVAIAITPGGDYVYVTGPPTDMSAASTAISILARDPTTGMLTPASEVENGTDGVSELSDMWGIAVSPGDDCLYATSRADSSIGAFTIDRATGGLTFDGIQTASVTHLGDARQVTVSPDGKNVYVAAPDDGGVAVFTRSSGGCSLTFLQIAQDLFTVGPPTVNRTEGTGTVPVTVQVPGTIDLTTEPSTIMRTARDAASPATVIHVTRARRVNARIRLDAEDRATLGYAGVLVLRAVVTFTAHKGSPTTKTVLVELRRPTNARIASDLTKVLTVHGVRTATLLKDRGYRTRFDAPGPGKLKVRWYASHKRLVAEVTVKVKGPRKVTISLTKAGRALLRRVVGLKVTSKATFTLTGSPPVRGSSWFTLR
jgi:6-phosphogluconolactonase (cycloisomerase 2 family)